VVIDQTRVLTCAHVVDQEYAKGAALWVSFPKAGVARAERRLVQAVRSPDDTDAAVLELAQPVPAAVAPAPLRSPQAADLVDQQWWAFGFPDGAEYGGEAHGAVGGPLAWGWVSLYTESRYRVQQGFSGAGLWSLRYQAVVGLVGRARLTGEHAGDGQAITLRQIEEDLPGEKLSALTAWSLPAAGESALTAWGWSLDTDEEAVRHWRPRARGVSVESERGFRFSGRRPALAEIVSWLERPSPDRRVLVVTGSPGVGKSAVLGRIVTTANVGVRAVLPANDDNVKAPVGSVACAIHVKGKTALDVAVELARAASARLPSEVEDLVPSLREALERHPGRRFNVVVDALDEATSAAQVRYIISAILLPIVQTCSDVGAQVVIGTRRADDGGDLLSEVGQAGRILNLDDEAYFAEEDLAAYALATVQLVGDERPDNPYEDTAVAQPVARRIAALADRNFLIAGLVARTHGSYDTEPIDPERLEFTPTVDAALAGYLRRLASVGTTPAVFVLTALAYASGQGFSIEVWWLALRSMGASVKLDQLADFTGSAAANFLVEVSHEGGSRRFRLFHQALNDALMRDRESRGARQADEEKIARGLMAQGRRLGWRRVDPYLLRSLPQHAIRAGMIDDLLADDDYLLHADLMRLTPLADRATTEVGKARARLLHLTPRAIRADPYDRAALLSMTQRMERLGNQFAPDHPAPYRVRWASVTRRTERTTLEGHASRINAVCSVAADDRVLLASASDDWTVRLWDPATSSQEKVLRGHTRGVKTLCAVPVPGRPMLASAGKDRQVRVWDPVSGREQYVLPSYDMTISALCPLTMAGRTVLAIGTADGPILLANPVAVGEPRLLRGYWHGVTHLCPIPLADRTLLAIADETGAVNVWDPQGGLVMEMAGGTMERTLALSAAVLLDGVYLIAYWGNGPVRIWQWEDGAGQATELVNTWIGRFVAVCSAEMDQRLVLATADATGSVGLWRLATRPAPDLKQQGTLTTQRARVSALCAFALGRRTYLASASDDRIVRLWDPATGREERALADRTVRALATVTRQNVPSVVGVTSDSVGLWRLADGGEYARLQGNTDGLGEVCVVSAPPALLLASAARDGTVRLWDLLSYLQDRPLAPHLGVVNAICSVTVGKDVLLASAHDDGSVRLWDLTKRRRATGALFGARRGRRNWLVGHTKRVTAIAPVTVAGRVRLASAGDDHALRIWDLDNGSPTQSFGMPHGHAVTAMCAVSVDGHPLLATAGQDHLVQLWDPATGRRASTLSGHADVVSGVTPVTVDGQVRLASASADRTIRVWNLEADSADQSIPVYHPALACAGWGSLLVVGLTAGIIGINLGDEPAI
jgi:WD40 repeat protein